MLRCELIDFRELLCHCLFDAPDTIESQAMLNRLIESRGARCIGCNGLLGVRHRRLPSAVLLVNLDGAFAHAFVCTDCEDMPAECLASRVDPVLFSQ